MPISALPPAPSRADPNTFSPRADALLGALAQFVTEANALEANTQASATMGTSSSSVAIGTGSRTFTTQADKGWIVGSWVYMVNSAAPANFMVGQITAYSGGTLTVNVATVSGSGTFTTWAIGLAVPTVAAVDLAGGAAGSLPYQDGANSTAMLAPGTSGQLLRSGGAGAPSWVSVASAVAGVAYLSTNRLINPTFDVKQRAFAGGALVAGIYGHDRWRAGASGVTYTVSGETATITAGSLQQVIEGMNVPEGGTYVLSWTGTAQASVNGGAPAASPIVVTGLVAEANVTIQFNTGTVTRPQFEAGNVASAFERRLFPLELALCQRYFYISTLSVLAAVDTAGSGTRTKCASLTHPAPMRVAPAISGITTTSLNSVTTTSVTALGVSFSGLFDVANASFVTGYTATAEL